MLLNILLVILVIVCVALTGVILLQRSEGGALGMGGGPTGMFTARGAGDLLSRTTSILAAMFFILSLGITLLAGHGRSASSITERLKVNPIDLNAIARPSQPAESSAPAANGAPPLPTAAPPLPTVAPTEAPRPTRRAVARPSDPLASIAVQPSAPPRVAIPRPNINAPAQPTKSGQ
jgi:preprotein translocase subunit SecG